MSLSGVPLVVEEVLPNDVVVPVNEQQVVAASTKHVSGNEVAVGTTDDHDVSGVLPIPPIPGFHEVERLTAAGFLTEAGMCGKSSRYRLTDVSEYLFTKPDDDA